MSIEFDYKTCHAELISDIDFSGIKKAWETSRPNDKTFSIDTVLSMDVPVNEFLFLQFELEAPIIVRELICSFRNHVVWARSSRVEDLSSWALWYGISYEEVKDCEVLYELMQKEKDTKHQDDFRRHLPLAYMTKFTFGMSFRDVVKFLGALKSANNPILHDVYANLLSAIVRKDVIVGTSIVEKLVSKVAYKPYNFFSSDFTFVGEDYQLGDFVSLNHTMTIQLRAQLVRHRAITFRDDFMKYFGEGKIATSMEGEVNSHLIIPLDFASELIRKRSCWIAQTDLWAPLVKKLQGKISNGRVMLPCEDGKCRFKRDNDLRKAGQDPSPPCPIAAKLENDPMNEIQATAALHYADNRPDFEFWRKEIQGV